MDIWKQLKDESKEFDIELSDEQIDKFKIYAEFLYEYNSHTNLIAKASMETIIQRHFLDSLAIGKIKNDIDWNKDSELIDIGIGGGFPGVPIIIANTKWKLTAIDSVGKKTKFLDQLAEKLGMQDRITVINSRVEELGKSHLEKYDIALARAVGAMPVLLEYSMAFLKKDGCLVAYKAKDIDEELKSSNKALHMLGAKIKDIVCYESQGILRKLVYVTKIKRTPDQYPRSVGIPKMHPLI